MPPKKFDLKSLVASGVPQKEEGFKLIPISDLYEHPSNSIFPISDDAVEDLAGTIALNGLLTPLTVTPREEGGYWIVSGSTRKRAVALLGWESVRCEIQHFKSETYLELALLTANVSTAQRTDRRSCFYAAGEKYKELRMKLAVENGEELPELSVRDIAEAIGTSKSEYQRQRTIKEKLAYAVECRWPNLPTSTALEFCKLPPEHQAGFAKLAPAGYRPEQKHIEEFRAAIGAGDNPALWIDGKMRKIREAEAAKRQAIFEAKAKQKAEEKKKKAENTKCERLGGDVKKIICNRTNGHQECNHCCGTCYERYFCDKICGNYIKGVRKNDFLSSRGELARKVRKARIKAGIEITDDLEESNVYFTDGMFLEKLTGAAKKYNVSADYLLGITDTPQPAAPAEPDRFAETWKRLDEEEPEKGMDVIMISGSNEIWNATTVYYWTSQKKKDWIERNDDVYWTLPPEAVQF